MQPHRGHRDEFVESRMRGDAHVRFGGRAGETGRSVGRYRASARPYSWLPTRVRGLFFYLYLIVDIYSRKIVAAEVFEAENGTWLSQLVRRAVLAEQCITCPPVLHTDNGSPMKGRTLKATLEWLQIQPSYSRPRVSNDNPYSEALFRTCKYRPVYPPEGFADLQAAQDWVAAFVRWYNDEHRHSAIRYVTPAERHEGRDHDILAHRKAVYEQARQNRPERWSGDTRDWQPIGPVTLNPQHVDNSSPTEELEVA